MIVDILFWAGIALGVVGCMVGCVHLRQEERREGAWGIAAYDQKWREQHDLPEQTHVWLWPEKTWLKDRLREKQKQDKEDN